MSDAAGDNATGDDAPVAERIRQRAAIDAFWTWWAGAADAVADALDADLREDFLLAVAPRVADMHSELCVYLNPPRNGRHCLVVSPGVDGSLYSLAERWQRAAPPDERWEFQTSIGPDRGRLQGPLELSDDLTIDLGRTEFVVSLHKPSWRFDIALHHPDYAFLTEEDTLEMALLAMHMVIGQDETHRWFRRIYRLPERPELDLLPLRRLPELSDGLARGCPAPGAQWERGSERSAAVSDGGAVDVWVAIPMRRVDFPLYDEYVTIALPYPSTDGTGKPNVETTRCMNDFARRLMAAAGRDAVAFAQEVGDGTRTLHLFADGEVGDQLLGRLDQVATTWSHGRVLLASRPDPGWSNLLRFTTEDADAAEVGLDPS